MRRGHAAPMPQTNSSPFAIAVNAATEDLAALRAAGYLIVTDYPGVRKDGAGDSTPGIQAAIDDGYAGRKAVYFPSGTYAVSNTLRCYMWRPWSASRGAATGSDPRNHVLVGSHAGPRPVIKLAGTAPLFDDPSTPRPVLQYRMMEALNSSATQTAYTGDPFANPPNYGDDASTLFRCELRRIEIDTSGHAGAVGLYFHAAQNSSVEDVRVVATGSYCGIWGLPGRSHGGVNIEVEGGQYGLRTKSAPSGMPVITGGVSGGAGIMVAGLRLFNQTVRPLDVGDSVPLAVAGLHIIKASGAVVVIDPGNTAQNTCCLTDGIVETASGVAFENATGKNFYLRNIYVKGTSELVKTAALATVTGSGAWKRIAEYCATDLTATSIPQSRFKTSSVIDGVISQAQQTASAIESDAAAPPADLISRHTYAFPSMDAGPFENILTHGAVSAPEAAIVGGGDPFDHDATTDSRAAIQAAIDAAHAAGHGRVLVPRGVFYLSGPLLLRSTTKLFGLGRQLSVLAVHDSWRPTSGSPFMIETEDSASATTFLGFLELVTKSQGGGGGVAGATPYVYDRFSHILWRSGKSSCSAALLTERQYADPAIPTNARTVHTFRGNGGGRHYFTEEDGRGNSGTGYRHVLIDGTSTPLWFYGLSCEASKGAAPEFSALSNVEINNASNIRIFSMKREGNAPSVIINGGSNIAVYGSGAMSAPPDTGAGGYMQVLGASSNILMANVLVRNWSGTSSVEPTLREHLSGQTERVITYPEGVSLYKRGQLDDAAARIS